MKHPLEKHTGFSIKTFRDIANELNGKLVKTTNHSIMLTESQCAYNSYLLHQELPNSEVWFGYRIYPNNGSSLDPKRTIQKGNHLCLEEHFLVKHGDQWICNTPSSDVVSGYEFYFVAVKKANALEQEFSGNYEYVRTFGLMKVPLTPEQVLAKQHNKNAYKW